MKVRIYYHHTDCGGVVYYANYLKFLEEARTEFFERLGFIMNEIVTKERFFVVARQEIDYKSPAFYGDILTINTWASSISNVRINFEYEIKKSVPTGRQEDEKVVCKAKTVLVYIDKNFKPTPMPKELQKRIEDSIVTNNA